MAKRLFLFLISVTFFYQGYAQKNQFKSGVYYPGLILAFDYKTKVISGFFETYKNYNTVTGKPESYCRFFIKGVMDNDSIRVNTFYPGWPDTVLGRFYNLGDTALNLKLQEEPPCWSYVEDENVVYTGMRFDFDHITNWLEIGMINKENVKILSDYSNSKAVVVGTAKYKDCVKVLSRRTGWVKIELLGDEDNVKTGWIKTTDFN